MKDVKVEEQLLQEEEVIYVTPKVAKGPFNLSEINLTENFSNIIHLNESELEAALQKITTTSKVTDSLEEKPLEVPKLHRCIEQDYRCTEDCPRSKWHFKDKKSKLLLFKSKLRNIKLTILNWFKEKTPIKYIISYYNKILSRKLIAIYGQQYNSHGFNKKEAYSNVIKKQKLREIIRNLNDLNEML